MGGGQSSPRAGGNYRAANNNPQAIHSNSNNMPNQHLHKYTKDVEAFLKKQQVKKIAREKNLNLHGKLIKSKLGLDIKSLTLKQSSHEMNRYYPRFKFSATEDCKISIYYCTNQVTNAEGVPMYFTIPSELPTAGIIEREQAIDKMYDKIKSTSFDVEKYEGMPLFNATATYFPCVITIEPEKKPTVGADGVSDYQNLITYWVFKIDKSKNCLEIKPFRQVLVAFDMAFNLQQIFGIDDAKEDNKEGDFAGYGDDGDVDDSQKCVVCITDEKNTVVMPCGHLCVCKDCATTISQQRSPDCPIWRSKVTSFVPLNIKSIKKMENEGYTRGSTYKKDKGDQESVDNGVEM